jgi:hypothetical protein
MHTQYSRVVLTHSQKQLLTILAPKVSRGVGEIGRVCAVLHHERELISMLPRQNSLQTLLKAAQHLVVPFTQRAQKLGKNRQQIKNKRSFKASLLQVINE